LHIRKGLPIDRPRFIIPCHRVIGRDGSLTDFGGGLAVKERLLALERPL
jgi:O6-methylguanine-DNA--protein-cysteine methyltransferase